MAELYKRRPTNKIDYKLSILILTLPNRFEKLETLISTLKKQSVNQPVQILYFGDNKTLSVGRKRNLALSMASGEYVCFVDDDDLVTEDYVSSILSEIEEKPDVIVFKVQLFKNGVKGKQYIYYENAPGRPYLAPDKSHYKLAPNHLCVWKRDIVLDSFPDKSLGEDFDWADKMANRYSKIGIIDKVLYLYYYDSNLSETHKGYR